MIRFYFESTKEFELKKSEIKLWLNKVITHENHILGDINVIFCSDDYLIKINKEYLSHDYFTDIVTFNFCEENKISGDIFISIDRVKENSKIYTTSFINELDRVIVHGVLHLLGYNDKSEEEKKIMTSKENQYLAIL